MYGGYPRRRRARPVADAPVDELLGRTSELAKAWLLALLEPTPLEDAPSILAAGIAQEGPRLCAAVLRALTHDLDLARLEAGGLLEPLAAACGGFAGAGGEAALRTVDALHAVVWGALRAELRDPHPDLVSELAERLGAVVELVRAAAIRRLSGGVVAAGASPALTREGHLRPVAPDRAERFDPEEPPAPGTAPAHATAEPAAAPADVAAAPSPMAASPREDPLWVQALDDEVVKARRAGTALTLLLIDLDESSRLRAAEPAAGAAAAFGRFAQAVRAVLRRQDLLASEAETRVWVIARDTGRAGATALADRIDASVRHSESLRGAPLRVSVGIAVLGEDAQDGSGLLEAAEESSFAAAATGAPVADPPSPAED